MERWNAENDLLKAVNNGDEKAAGEWVDRYSGALFTLAFRYTQSVEDAEDIVQETLLRGLKNLPGKNPNLPFTPWLCRVAINLCRDRARKRQTETFSDISMYDGDGVPDKLPLPEAEIITQETAEEMRAAVLELPETERMAVTLRYNENLSYEEIAEVLGIPVQTVGTHLFRARQRLRGRLAQQEAEHGAASISSGT